MRDGLKLQIIRALASLPVRVIARPLFAGDGVIFTLHRIVECPEDTLVPGIAITDRFLEEIVSLVHAAGHEFIPLSEVPKRLAGNASRRRWVCLTFDDGFRDNLTLASPILKRLGVPYTLFLVSDWVLGTAVNHAALLEAFLRDRTEATLVWNGETLHFDLTTRAQKLWAYQSLDVKRWRDRAFDAALPSLLEAQGVNAAAVMREGYLLRDDALAIAADGCCEIGSHTRRHAPLAHLAESDARAELDGSRAALADLFGRAPTLVAYPYGSLDQCGTREFAMAASAGYTVGVTTRLGNVFRDDASHPLSLPRTGLSLHPHSHSREFIVSVLSGSRNAFMNRGRRQRE